MIRAKIFSRETGECEVVFREGTDYEVLTDAERDMWETMIDRWIRAGGVNGMGRDEDGLPTLEYVDFDSEDFPRALKAYLERQFNTWHVELVGGPSSVLSIDRERLRAGKYTKAYARLTSEQLEGLLWLLGEWSIRHDNDHPRAVAAKRALLEFNYDPLTLGEALALMRGATRGER